MSNLDRPYRRLAQPNPSRIALFGGVVVVALCVALVAPVFAFASRSSHEIVVRKNSKGSVTATCPKGEHVSFGGVVAEIKTPFEHPPAEVDPEGMRRTANNTWTVYGMSQSPLGGSHLTAVAFCDHGSAAPSVATATAPLIGLSTGTAVATCPNGTVVVGGGYNSAAAPKHDELVVRLDRPSASQWRVTMYNNSLLRTTVTAIAYCAPGVAPKLSSATVTVAPHKSATVRADCPRGTSIVFGGELGDSSFSHTSDAFTAVAPFSWTAPSTTQWAVGGSNVGFGNQARAGRLTALAYCR